MYYVYIFAISLTAKPLVCSEVTEEAACSWPRTSHKEKPATGQPPGFSPHPNERVNGQRAQGIGRFSSGMCCWLREKFELGLFLHYKGPNNTRTLSPMHQQFLSAIWRYPRSRD